MLQNLISNFFGAGQKKDEAANRYKVCKLIMVTDTNHNKFYDMKQISDNFFEVHYGRVGNKASIRNYPMSRWESLYREKVGKGYRDQSAFFADIEPEKEARFVGVKSADAQDLLRRLTRYAEASIDYHYAVKADQVTPRQVQEAQWLLDEIAVLLYLNTDTVRLNRMVLEFYQIVPRKMNKVKEHLFEPILTPEELEKAQDKLAQEQEILDVMKGQVQMQQQKGSKTKEGEIKEIDVLKQMNLLVELVEEEQEIELIKSKMDSTGVRFLRAFRISNTQTEERFESHLRRQNNQHKELFWHGSRNENWLSILQNGLQLHPAKAVITGKMFGYGIYFADKFNKSLNYTSLRGSLWTGGKSDRAFLALYQVHLGNPLTVRKHQAWCSDLNYKKLKAKGEEYDSLFAEGGADLINNEYIVYKEEQCTIKYLVEIC
ncbi:WGR domain-containing protein [Hugenholtzia roseola]|uniref:WGR domain-containing protein n=1 Tax=Hugenholtzia roseola TaxID=1002 RepID=UPI000416F7F3|nr:WGR domain-containing protein [Hugenholtzia roseola]